MRQGPGPLVRTRPQQGGGRGDAAHAYSSARVRGVSPVPATEAQALPSGGDPGRLLQGLPGPDYATIIAIAEKIPEAVLQEDQKLLLWYDQALTRTAGAA